jgi:hypothetical protein
MSLIHYLKPFFDLGICKEYRMARKATGNGAPTRSKRSATPLQPVEAQGAADLSVEVSEVPNETSSNEITPREARNGKPLNPVPINQRSLNQNSINPSATNQNSANQNSANQNSTHGAANQGSLNPEMEEEIRHRAYELYLQRRGNGDVSSGDPHQDWLTAEREVLSRYSNRERKSA